MNDTFRSFWFTRCLLLFFALVPTSSFGTCKTELAAHSIVTDSGRFSLGFNPDTVLLGKGGTLYQLRDAIDANSSPLVVSRQVRVLLGEEGDREIFFKRLFGLAVKNEYHSLLFGQGLDEKLYLVGPNSQFYEESGDISVVEAPVQYGLGSVGTELPLEFRPFRRSHEIAFSIGDGAPKSGGIALSRLESSIGTSGESIPVELEVSGGLRKFATLYVLTQSNRIYSKTLYGDPSSDILEDEWDSVSLSYPVTHASFIGEGLFVGVFATDSGTRLFTYCQGKIQEGPLLPKGSQPVAIAGVGTAPAEISDACSVQGVWIAYKTTKGKYSVRQWTVGSTALSKAIGGLPTNLRLTDLVASQARQDSERLGFYVPYFSITDTFDTQTAIARRLLVGFVGDTTGTFQYFGLTRDGFRRLPSSSDWLSTKLPEKSGRLWQGDSPQQNTTPVISLGDD